MFFIVSLLFLVVGAGLFCAGYALFRDDGAGKMPINRCELGKVED